MPRKVKITSDHDQIRRWVELRGGWPAMVQRAATGGAPRELRIGFSDAARDENVKQISWGEFFQKIDEGGFALEYEERDDDGGLSEFHRIIPRNEARNLNVADLRRPTRAAGRRLQRLVVRAGEGAEGRLSEEKSHRRKKMVRSIDQGRKTKKKKIKKAA